MIQNFGVVSWNQCIRWMLILLLCCIAEFVIPIEAAGGGRGIAVTAKGLYSHFLQIQCLLPQYCAVLGGSTCLHDKRETAEGQIENVALNYT